jgi:hypothetical protein
VLHFAGFRSGLLNNLSSGTSTPGQLESLFMANGYLLAKNGWLNQRSHAVGLHNARNIMQAAKQGGAEEAKPSPFSGGISDILNNEMMQTLQTDAYSRLQKTQDSYRAKSVVDV